MQTLLISIRCFLSGAILLAALQCIAAEPTTLPLPRLETGMHIAVINRIATDAARRWAVTASDDKTARVWEVVSGRQLVVLRPPQDVGNEGKLFAVALSPNGAVVAVGGWTGWYWDKEVAIYLFDRASGRLLRRLPGLPSAVHHLAFSPDGRWLAASLGGVNGVRIFEATRGKETGRDAAYGDTSHSVHFSPDGRRLLTTSYDGQVRLYAVNDGTLGQPTRASPGGGQRPYAVRFSPDGRRIAAGFDDSTVVQVLDANTLKEIAWPSTVGVDNGNLRSVAWSADGRFLVAGGQWAGGGKHRVRRWTVNAWSQYNDVPVANNTVKDLVALPGGGLLFTAGEPAWGVLNTAGQIQIDAIEFAGRMAGIAADDTDSRTFTLPPQQGQREISPRPAAAPSLYVLAIGVSLYRDKELQKGVRFAAHDADTMGQLFREQGALLYQSVNVRVLSDSQATGDAIRTAFVELSSRIAAQDVFVLYLAGHSASFDREYHFLPWDAVYTSTTALRQRSLTHEHFRELLAKIPAAKTVVLLDTCTAGSFGRQDGRDIGQKDALDRLSRLTGRAMIAATADDKMVIEGEGGHSAFTFTLLEGLRGKADRNGDGFINVRELADYVEERLPEITRKWSYEQFPFSATEGNSFTLVPKP